MEWRGERHICAPVRAAVRKRRRARSEGRSSTQVEDILRTAAASSRSFDFFFPFVLFSSFSFGFSLDSAVMDSFILAALALCSLTAPACADKGSSKARSCSNFRTFYKGKLFPMDGVPQSEISGKFLESTPIVSPFSNYPRTSFFIFSKLNSGKSVRQNFQSKCHLTFLKQTANYGH